MRRHESLRTGFVVWADEQSAALIMPAEDARWSLPVEDMTTKKREDPRVKSLQLKKAALCSEQDAWLPFDISRAPLLRTRLLRLDTDDHILLLTLHHIVADGWSIGLLFEEISKLYCAFADGRRDPLPEPVQKFSDFARRERLWCATDAAARQLAYWAGNLREASPVFHTPGHAVGAHIRVCEAITSQFIYREIRSRG